jgi:hypothetical protein
MKTNPLADHAIWATLEIFVDLIAQQLPLFLSGPWEDAIRAAPPRSAEYLSALAEQASVVARTYIRSGQWHNGWICNGVSGPVKSAAAFADLAAACKIWPMEGYLPNICRKADWCAESIGCPTSQLPLWDGADPYTLLQGRG